MRCYDFIPRLAAVFYTAFNNTKNISSHHTGGTFNTNIHLRINAKMHVNPVFLAVDRDNHDRVSPLLLETPYTIHLYITTPYFIFLDGH